MEVEMEGSFASFVEKLGTLSLLAIIGLIGTFRELIIISNNRISHSNKEVIKLISIKLVKIKASAILFKLCCAYVLCEVSSSSCAVLMFSVRSPSNTLHQDGHDLACHINRHATSSVTASAALPSHSTMSALPHQQSLLQIHQQSLLQIITNSAASFHELEFCYSQQNLPPKCITLIIL
ncbi:hypothetical protein ACOSQ3_017983 [Xanthoceras sorbifolium]